MLAIVDFSPATNVLQTIERTCAAHVGDAEIRLLGPQLIDKDIGKLSYAEYENSFRSVSLEKIESLVRDVTTNVVFLLPGAAYDLYFNDLELRLRRPNFEVWEERDVILFDSHELQIRFHKIKHYAAVILRNRGERIARSALVSNVGNKPHGTTFETDNWNIVFGWIYVAKEYGVKVPSVNTYVELCLEDKFKKYAVNKHVVEIINTSLSNAKNHLVILPDDMYAVYDGRPPIMPARVTVVSESFLSFDLAEHVLVPRHGVVDGEALDRIRARYGNTDEFPLLFTDDPISKWYGFSEGQIVEIHRDNAGVAETYYRRVAKP